MNDTITFSTRTEFELTFMEFFEIYYYNDQTRYNYARRVWEKMIQQIGGTECEFNDEVGFHDFKGVITGLKIDAESDTYDTESEDEEKENKPETTDQTDSDSD